jgi:hypothetical protein
MRKKKMVSSWANWKPFPNPDHGGHIDAPIGPGVFEVRHTGTGEQIAFAHSANVAQSLAILLPRPVSGLRLLFARKSARCRSDELEYRTWAASSLEEARTIAERLRGRREAYMRRRAAVGWS